MKLLLLDSNSLINRAFYALPTLQDRSGRYTGALFGFVSMLSKLIKSEKPTHIVAAFDVHQPTFRHLKYDGYKAKRHPMPEELKAQVPAMKELLSAMGIAVVELPGFEADDIIGTLATRSEMPTVVVSGDKDVLQLVSDKTTVLHTKKGITDVIRYTPEVLKEEGLSPRGIIELKSLMGDHSDNIPGVPGVGEKTALDLVRRYGTLDNLYAHIDEIKGKMQEKLLNGRESAEFSHWLATIVTDAPLDSGDFSRYRFSEMIPYRAKKLMEGYEFRKLIDRFTFSEPEAEDITDHNVSERELKDLNDLRALLAEANGAGALAFYVADDHFDLAYSEDQNSVMRCSYDLFGEYPSYDEILEEIKGYLGKKGVDLTVFDLKKNYRTFDLSVEEIFPADDVMLMAYIADCGTYYDTPEDLLRRYELDETKVAAGLLTLKRILTKKMIQANSLKVYQDIELPLVPVLYDMEKTGFRVDRSTLDALSEKYSAELATVRDKIYALAGREFNINSPKQLSEVLFDDLKLPAGKKKSTNADVLSEIEDLHPIVSEILRFRQLSKLLSTYLIAMKSMIDAKGRIHTVFHQALTTTGRLSSSEPNLQNIPVREAEGREIRAAFIPGDGNLLISADYSQIELRLLADFSGDEGLIESFRNGEDIHASTAAKIFGVSEKEVTSKMRRDAKAVNFGIIYGISDFGLSRNVGCSVPEARDFIAKYLDTYPKIREYMKSSVDYAKEHGYVSTRMGRIRSLPEINSSNYNVRSFGERAALNMPLQGTAADIIKLAMIGVYRALRVENLSAKVILQVHDELIVDAPLGEVPRVKEILKKEMENVVSLSVPLSVNISCGATWKEAK